MSRQASYASWNFRSLIAFSSFSTRAGGHGLADPQLHEQLDHQRGEVDRQAEQEQADRPGGLDRPAEQRLLGAGPSRRRRRPAAAASALGASAAGPRPWGPRPGGRPSSRPGRRARGPGPAPRRPGRRREQAEGPGPADSGRSTTERDARHRRNLPQRPADAATAPAGGGRTRPPDHADPDRGEDRAGEASGPGETWGERIVLMHPISGGSRVLSTPRTREFRSERGCDRPPLRSEPGAGRPGPRPDGPVRPGRRTTSSAHAGQGDGTNRLPPAHLALDRQSSPRSCRASRRAMESPRPNPLASRSLLSTWIELLEDRCRWVSGGMPDPVFDRPRSLTRAGSRPEVPATSTRRRRPPR